MTLATADHAFTFDDFILVPQQSEVLSRKDPDITSFGFQLPIFTAPMDTISEENMAMAMHEVGACAVIHRYMTPERQAEIAHNLNIRGVVAYFAVGTTEDAMARIPALVDNNVAFICVDVANGHSIHALNTVEAIKKKWPGLEIMSGNVCTPEGVRQLINAGTDVIRVGIGSGAMCTTRMVTGHGLPQLSALEECCAFRDDFFPEGIIVADGGIRGSGDIVKALAIGADMVMIGSLLAGTSETPGEILEDNGHLYKYYQGMASERARKNWFDKSKAGLPVEGVATRVPYEGKSAKAVVEGLCKSLKVGLSYSGAHNLKELRERAVWRRVTSAGFVEGTPHGKRS